MRIAIITVLTIIFIITGAPEQACHPALHHFMHGNVFHLAVNCLSVWFIFRRWKVTEIATAYAIATASWFTAPIPAIGFSNIIFATIGLRTPSLSSTWWRRSETIIFLSVTLLMFLLPNVSAVTHVVSFMAGTFVAMATRWIKGNWNDCKRYMD